MSFIADSRFRMKRPGKARKCGFRRHAPDLPGNLTTETGAAAVFEARDISIAERLIKEVRAEDLTASSLNIDSSVLERVSLANSRIGSMVWKDVRLVGCDLANLETRRLTLVRVEFINCRMT